MGRSSTIMPCCIRAAVPCARMAPSHYIPAAYAALCWICRSGVSPPHIPSDCHQESELMHAIMPCCIRAAVAFTRILFSHFYTAECRRACVGSPHSPREDCTLPLLSTHARLSVLPRRRGPALPS